MSGAHEIVFPKPVLVGAGMLLSATIVLATLGGHGALIDEDRDALNTEIVDSLDVRFLDREDGAVVALAAGEETGKRSPDRTCRQSRFSIRARRASSGV